MTKFYQLIRLSSDPKQTKGELRIIEGTDVVWSCKTLELPWRDNASNVSCIPDGFYITKRHVSPTFGDCFHVTDVPNRSHILFHAGNYAASKNPRTGVPDTKGCILPGKAFADIDGDGLCDVTSSGPTMRELLQILPDEFELEIFTEG
jgi:hypothetical protein